MSNKTYYWSGKGSSFSQGKNKPLVGFGEEMPPVEKEHLAMLLKQGLVSTEKTVTDQQLSELERLRLKVSELAKGVDNSRVEELEKENAELKEKLSSGQNSEIAKSIKELLEGVQQTDKKEELWEAIKLVKAEVEGE